MNGIKKIVFIYLFRRQNPIEINNFIIKQMYNFQTPKLLT